MAVQKPTKQQIAQAKARAGGNNPIKVTNAGLKKLGSAALIAASFTPVGRAAKIATTAVRASNAAKTARATKTLATSKAAAAKTEQIAKNSVKVLPRKTAPKTDLSSRGAKPTKSQRSERASDLYFNKAEGRWEGEYLTKMTGLRGPKGVTSQSTRGQGERSLRKTAAIKKEAKPVVKINSQRNLKKK